MALSLLAFEIDFAWWNYKVIQINLGLLSFYAFSSDTHPSPPTTRHRTDTSILQLRRAQSTTARAITKPVQATTVVRTGNDSRRQKKLANISIADSGQEGAESASALI
jgi:hypothetical protein